MQGEAKDVAQQAIGQLPDEATFNDIMYELYIRQKIEVGLQAVEEGRTIPHNEVKRRLLSREN